MASRNVFGQSIKKRAFFKLKLFFFVTGNDALIAIITSHLTPPPRHQLHLK
jgi:hypothetical protein